MRAEQIAIASIPVGEIMDVRNILGELAIRSQLLAERDPVLGSTLSVDPDGSVSASVQATLEKPTHFPVEYMPQGWCA